MKRVEKMIFLKTSIFIIQFWLLINAVALGSAYCIPAGIYSPQSSTLSPQLSLNTLVLKSGFLNNSPELTAGELSLIALLKEGQRIINKGFLESNDLMGQMVVFDTEYRSSVEHVLKNELAGHVYREQLEKVLTIKERLYSFGTYYGLEFTDTFLKEIKNSPNIIFDEWAWDKAAEFADYAKKNNLNVFGATFGPLEEIFGPIGVKKAKEQRKIKEYLELKKIKGPPYLGMYSVGRKKLAAVVREIDTQRNSEYKWMSLRDYSGLGQREKQTLEFEFQNAFDVEFLQEKTKYPLAEEKAMPQLIQAAKELGSIIGPNDRGICLGRTPFYIFYAARAIEAIDGSVFNGQSERYVQTSFSGGAWVRSGEDTPDNRQVRAFRKYLNKLHLTPQEIIAKANKMQNPGKTVIVDFLDTGTGVEAFLSILMDWAGELNIPVNSMQKALIVYSLRKGNVASPLPSNLLGVPVLTFETLGTSNFNFVNANDANYLDGIKDSYYVQDWADVSIDPTNDVISYKGYLICAHILSYLEKNRDKQQIKGFSLRTLTGIGGAAIEQAI